MHTHAYDALGTRFSITIWDMPLWRVEELSAACKVQTHAFDALYSRFKHDSLVSRMSTARGVYEVPRDLTSMLRLYQLLYQKTRGALTPTVGFALADTGYDAAYSLMPQEHIRAVPPLERALSILDDTHLELHEAVLLDVGALGKGYCVDLLHAFLVQEGATHFLVDGSGDVRYERGEGGEPMVCGLEHPEDTSLAIGTFSLSGGSLCASATNRRTWRGRTHYIDPRTNTSPEDVRATWVWAPTAALADGVSSALFFVEPEALADIPFEYLVVNRALKMKRSAGFSAELFQ